jgi:hypothetical protein
MPNISPLYEIQGPVGSQSDAIREYAPAYWTLQNLAIVPVSPMLRHKTPLHTAIHKSRSNPARLTDSAVPIQAFVDGPGRKAFEILHQIREAVRDNPSHHVDMIGHNDGGLKANPVLVFQICRTVKDDDRGLGILEEGFSIEGGGSQQIDLSRDTSATGSKAF